MIKIGAQLGETIEQLEREKGIPRVVVVESIKEAMGAAFRRSGHATEEEFEVGYEVRLNEKTGELGIFKLKKVVETVKDDKEEISIHDALEIDAATASGQEVWVDITPDDFGRIAAQSAKQVMMQRIREAEKRLIYNEFEERRGIVTPAIIQRIEGRNVVVSIGRIEAIMPPKEQLPGEYYRVGNKIRVYVADLRDNGRVPQIVVSQAHPEMVREVFELEIPEIEDGVVELKSIARDAGYRTKVAVQSHSGEVDAQGACIGQRGSRIQAIVNELKNEKIDIIRYSENPVEYITNALAPAKIISVDIIANEDNNKVARIIVPDDQLSLAIGREGQNVRLAARLTGWRLDIKSASQLQAIEAGESPDTVGKLAKPEKVETYAVAAAADEETETLDISELDELLAVDEEQPSAVEAAEEAVAEAQADEEIMAENLDSIEA